MFNLLVDPPASSPNKNRMFNLGDLVRHKTTGIKGKVIGYGCRQVSENLYLTTLKVELRSYRLIKPIAEDLLEKWNSNTAR